MLYSESDPESSEITSVYEGSDRVVASGHESPIRRVAPLPQAFAFNTDPFAFRLPTETKVAI